MSFITVQNVSHIYHAGEEQEHRALSEISLSIEEGEFVAILGTNGSGKSTLARHINGLLLPSSGHVLVDGMDTQETENIWNIRREVGMVFQNPDNQIIAAVVEDDVAFGPENIGMEPDRIRKNVHEALEIVGMTHFRSFAPHLLSGGQKQRIAIAGALAMQTKCLVLDEATAMLDPRGRQEVMETIQRLHRESHITILLITHFMEEAVQADRILVLDKGEVFAAGTPREVFSRGKALENIGLELPLASRVAGALARQGIPLADGILTKEELAAALQALWQAR